MTMAELHLAYFDKINAEECPDRLRISPATMKETRITLAAILITWCLNHQTKVVKADREESRADGTSIGVLPQEPHVEDQVVVMDEEAVEAVAKVEVEAQGADDIRRQADGEDAVMRDFEQGEGQEEPENTEEEEEQERPTDFTALELEEATEDPDAALDEGDSDEDMEGLFGEREEPDYTALELEEATEDPDTALDEGDISEADMERLFGEQEEPFTALEPDEATKDPDAVHGRR
ncbi:hypothetical protein FB45DRAFT_562529 [Roridomyces roridus]|uniref:Uncharacterized protein n=1 Tax=Roridomyces roridus TaxID=1738132 RepID=A0AAD7AZF5_9AGAR|nr:hypothetical protein FB45DRAFT_562529 [Roridomyces roridus]